MTRQTTRMKICGLRRPSDIEAVNAVRPEYCGFIFDRTRRRYISPVNAQALRQRLDPSIRPVGVFVDAGTRNILDALNQCPLDMVQLHGQETNDDIDELREALKMRRLAPAADSMRGRSAGDREHAERSFVIVKAFRIDTPRDMERAVRSHADLILLDHGIGGTGETFDWSLIRDCPRPFILAGGLGPENVALAIERTHPFAVDASSSLETDGCKDPDRIRRFAAAVRSAGAEEPER